MICISLFKLPFQDADGLLGFHLPGAMPTGWIHLPFQGDRRPDFSG